MQNGVHDSLNLISFKFLKYKIFNQQTVNQSDIRFIDFMAEFLDLVKIQFAYYNEIGLP